MTSRLLALACCVAAALTACGRDEPTARTAAAGGPVLETKRPEGEPRGVVLVLPGGAWVANPRTAVRQSRHYQERFNAEGWVVTNVGYRPGGQTGYADVLKAYDQVRDRDPRLPVCAVGESAGGQLGLILAAERELACVEAIAAPTDLRALPGEVRGWAADAFGAGELARWSPVTRAGDIDESVLLVQTPGDPLVPDSQGEALARVRPATRILSLEPGDVRWIHGTSVSRASFRRYLQEEKAFLARAAAGR